MARSEQGAGLEENRVGCMFIPDQTGRDAGRNIRQENGVPDHQGLGEWAVDGTRFAK
jgi:hypothetical protein